MDFIGCATNKMAYEDRDNEVGDKDAILRQISLKAQQHHEENLPIVVTEEELSEEEFFRLLAMQRNHTEHPSETISDAQTEEESPAEPSGLSLEPIEK